MRLASFAVVCALICVALAEFPESEWRRTTRADGDLTTTFTLALKLNNLDQLDALAERISTPGTPLYRQWRTLEELNEITKPDSINTFRLTLWLKRHSLEVADYGDFLKVSGKISDVEKAFDAEYHVFENIIYADDVSIIRSIRHPVIPEQFREFVVFITGVSNFPYPAEKRMERVKRADNVGNYFVVPQTLRAQYSVPSTYTATNSNSSQAVVEFGARAGISIPDLQKFMQLTSGNQNANLSYTVGNFIYNALNPIDIESTLDVQYIMGIAPGVPTSFFVVDGWIYDFATLVQQRVTAGLQNPWIFSLSYGYSENAQCQITGAGTGCGQLGGSSSSYVINTNVGLQKLGMLGFTIVVASGDSGAASSTNNNCRNKQTPIVPDYPASSEWVTAVGGTMYQTANVLSAPLPPFCTEASRTCAGSGVEIVSQVPEALITSGGGFSNYEATPTWQQAAVSAYLTSGALLPPSKDFNSTGRGYPDITGLAHHFMIVHGGAATAVDGTSASAPLTAGIFALIQDNIFNQGGSPLGFVNPALYVAAANNANTFIDITFGNNTTTEKQGSGLNPCTTVGYGATAGWDATSGLGSINYPVLLAQLVGL